MSDANLRSNSIGSRKKASSSKRAERGSAASSTSSSSPSHSGSRRQSSRLHPIFKAAAEDLSPVLMEVEELERERHEANGTAELSAIDAAFVAPTSPTKEPDAASPPSTFEIPPVESIYDRHKLRTVYHYVYTNREPVTILHDDMSSTNSSLITSLSSRAASPSMGLVVEESVLVCDSMGARNLFPPPKQPMGCAESIAAPILGREKAKVGGQVRGISPMHRYASGAYARASTDSVSGSSLAAEQNPFGSSSDSVRSAPPRARGRKESNSQPSLCLVSPRGATAPAPVSLLSQALAAPSRSTASSSCRTSKGTSTPLGEVGLNTAQLTEGLEECIRLAQESRRESVLLSSIGIDTENLWPPVRQAACVVSSSARSKRTSVSCLTDDNAADGKTAISSRGRISRSSAGLTGSASAVSSPSGLNDTPSRSTRRAQRSSQKTQENSTYCGIDAMRMRIPLKANHNVLSRPLRADNSREQL